MLATFGLVRGIGTLIWLARGGDPAHEAGKPAGEI
jgi:hypothetical protein